MTAPDAELVSSIRGALADAADPAKAAPMQAYMKSEMPYRGIPSPDLKAVLRPLLANHPLDEETWQATVLALWDEAGFREERYAALALARHRLHREHRQAGSVGPRPSRASSRGVHRKAEEGGDAPASTTDDNAAGCPRGGAQQDMGPTDAALVHTMGLYEHLVRTGAWWDLVDETSTHLVRELVLTHPAEVRPVIQEWAVADDLWVRRSAIICQVGAGDALDQALLAEAIEANLDGSTRTTPAVSPYGREFFIRKAIGWALRDHARVDPDWVSAFVDRHHDELAGLSRREALKHIAPQQDQP